MRIGVLGLGSMGARHVRNLQALGHEVVGFDVSMQNGVTAGDVLNCSVRVLATPTKWHYSQLQGWGTSYPEPATIFVEKPIAMTRKEWQAMSEYGDMNRPIMVGCNLRFHQAVRKVKEWMDLGLLGTPLWSQFTAGFVRESGKYGEDGVTLSSGAHIVDLAYHLLGPAKVVAASVNPEDTICDAALLHDNGCRTTVHVDWVTHPRVNSGVICGSKSRVHFELDPGRAYYRITRDGVLSNIYTCNDSADLNYAEEMAAFVDFAQGKPLVGASGADGLAVLGLLLDIKEMAGLVT